MMPEGAGECKRRVLGGGLLVGVDLLKPIEVLEAAYDDPLGVTAAFMHLATVLRLQVRPFATSSACTRGKP